MQFPQNSTIRRYFTAFFALVTLLGQGLHLLPGLGHAHSPGGCCAHQVSHSTSCGHGAERACDGHAHHHHHPSVSGNSEVAIDETGPDAAGWTRSPLSCGDCPVCQFLARAQLPAAFTAELISAPLPPQVSPAVPSIFCGRDCFEPHAPRGPPAAALFLA